MMKKSIQLLAGASLLVMGTSYSGISLAQEANSEEIGEDDNNIIVVTAQKRAESIQDVSLSIQAFDSEGLENGGITDVSRLELLVSGVNFSFTGNDAKFNVRGANSTNTFSDNSSIVGAYVDGVYKARASQQTRAFFDVERVEFLKGPQGTLYGRNTFAGALNLYTNKPVLGEFEAGIEAGYERFDTVKAQGYLNIPLGDDLAVRFAGYVNKGDGYIENLAGPDIGQQDDKGFRVSALWAPSDRFNVVARIQHSKEDGREAGLFGYTFLCRNVTPSGHTDAFGSQSDCANPNRGSGPNPNFAANSGQPGTGPFTIAQDYVPDVDLEETVISFEANVDLGNIALKSITSYTDFQNLFGFDFDFSPNPNSRGGFDETAEAFTQEFTISTDFDGPLNFTGGAYYSYDEQFFSFSIFNQTARDDSQRSVNVPVLDNNGNAVIVGGAPLLLPVLTATPLASLDTSLNGFFADSNFIESNTIGVFGQAEFAITEQLRLIGGIRYSNENKEGTGGGSNFTPNGPVTVNPQFAAGSSPTIIPDSRDVFIINRNAAGANTSDTTFDNVDYKVGVEFDVADDVLLYANTATGFLSGVVNNNGTTTDQQESQVYEIGLKSLLLQGDLIFNVALHYTEYTNLLAQFQMIDPTTGIGVTFSENGGEIEAFGAEVELQYQPIEALTLSLNASYLDAQFGTFGQTSSSQLNNGLPSAFVDLEGETPIFSPDFTLSLAGSYEFDLGSDYGTLTPYVQFYYSDGFNTSNLFALDPAAFQGSYTKTDARLVWAAPDKNYSIEAFVENIEDTAVLSRSNNNGGDDLLQSSFSFPRNYGLRFRADF